MSTELDRRAFLRLALSGVAGVAAGGALAACSRNSPPIAGGKIAIPGGSDRILIDQDPEAVIFSGGITRQSDGSYYCVYQKKPVDGAHSFIRGRLLMPVGPEETFYDGVSIDPSVATLSSGETVILVHRKGSDALIVRRSDGSFERGAQFGPAGESMISTVGDRTYVAYAEAQSPDPFEIKVFAREVRSATEVGPEIDTGARTGALRVEEHEQKRSSIGGLGSDLVLAWNRPETTQGGPRSIWISTSSNGGTTWGSPEEIARTGADLRNPFVLEVSEGETRIYYVQPGHSLGAVRTADGGSSWSQPEDVPLPPGVTGSARPAFFVEGGKVYCYTSYGSRTEGGSLVIFDVT